MKLDYPFIVSKRPCESLVREAQEIFQDGRKNGSNVSSIKIKGVGKFSEAGLAVRRKFSNIAKTSRDVATEASWLSKLNCSSVELQKLQENLWNWSPTSVILRVGKKSIDVTSFADLTEERYIDSFVIDISIVKYCQEARAKGKDNSLYFRTEDL